MRMQSSWVYTAASVAAMLAGLASSPACAEVTFEWATVANAGNAADPLNEEMVPGIGSVGDEYRIAKHEVTNDQYTEFLNAVAATDTNGLYIASMGNAVHGGITQEGVSGSFTYAVKANMGDKPVNYVSFFHAMRFVNWLHNGQPSGAQGAGTTEDGVYVIDDGISETRAAGVQFFLPTENEWYKAAYHQPSVDGGDADDYWLYPTASNSVPIIATANATGDISNSGANVANYFQGADWNGEDGNVTTVGSAGALSESFYGTSDQGGNVFEWSETVATDEEDVDNRVVRGGSFFTTDTNLRSGRRLPRLPTVENVTLGFRVARALSVGQETPRKNRYISLVRNTLLASTLDFRLTLASTLVSGVDPELIGRESWANGPDADCISIVGPSKPTMTPNWSGCPIVHLTGCAIIPTSTYDIIVTDGEGTPVAPAFSGATQTRPADNKWWCDAVGFFNGVNWTDPNGVTNFDDVIACLKTFIDPTKTPGCGAPPCNATHTSVTDIHPNRPDLGGSSVHPNKLVNFDDCFQFIQGFLGMEYPGGDLASCTDP